MRIPRLFAVLALIALLAWLTLRAVSERRAREELARGGAGASSAAAGGTAAGGGASAGGALQGVTGSRGLLGGYGPAGAADDPSSGAEAAPAAGAAAGAEGGEGEENETLRRVSTPEAEKSSQRSSASSGSAARASSPAARPASAGRVSEPRVEDVEGAFSSFMKKMREKAGPAPARRPRSGSYASGSEVERVSAEEMRSVYSAGSDEKSVLNLSPTYKRLKQAQKNNLDAVSMTAAESDGQKSRAGAWSDGNTVIRSRIPIQQNRGAFGSEEIGAKAPDKDEKAKP